MPHAQASILSAISLLALGASCGDDGERTAHPCDLEHCTTDPACEPIRATPIDTGKACATAHEQLVACQPRATVACARFVTYASDEQGEVWKLEADCLPPGWTEFPAIDAPSFIKPGLCPSPDVEAACAALDAAGCSSSPDCMMLHARLFNGMRGCFEDFLRNVGCTQLQPCNGALTYASDGSGGEGRFWEFEGGCLPATWERRSPSGLLANGGGAPPRCP